MTRTCALAANSSSLWWLPSSMWLMTSPGSLLDHVSPCRERGRAMLDHRSMNVCVLVPAPSIMNDPLLLRTASAKPCRLDDAGTLSGNSCIQVHVARSSNQLSDSAYSVVNEIEKRLAFAL